MAIFPNALLIAGMGSVSQEALGEVDMGIFFVMCYVYGNILWIVPAGFKAGRCQKRLEVPISIGQGAIQGRMYKPFLLLRSKPQKG